MIPGVRRGLFSTAYACAVAHLKTHPLLANKRVIKTWFAWDGVGCPAEPTAAQMPAAQVRLLGGPIDRISGARTSGGPGETISRATVALVVDLWIPGQDVGDLADVGELAYDALFPMDRAERSALEAKFSLAGIADHRMTRPILPLSAESYGAGWVAGQGMIELTLHIDS